MRVSSIILGFLCSISWLAACSSGEENASVHMPVPWVKTVQVEINSEPILELSGTVHARFETPMAFQLNGRIATRHIDAGQHVAKGQILFKLDTSDLSQSIRVAEAEHAAAQVALATISSDVVRDQKLLAENFISKKALQQTELAKQEAKTRLNAAQAKLQQAHNALSYASLRAEEPGILVKVTGESNQVVNFGQIIAILARDGEREVEVFFPENIKPRQAGSIRLSNNSLLPLILREVAGAMDPASRTWRARYRIMEDSHNLSLGELVKTRFSKNIETTKAMKVPLGVLDERGEGTQIWQLLDGKVYPVPAKIISVDTEYAWIDADLLESNQIVALGTNLLKSGMIVQALTR